MIIVSEIVPPPIGIAVTKSVAIKEINKIVEEKIEKLKAAMNEAVAKQEFEEAAKIRDEIKALEGGETK